MCEGRCAPSGRGGRGGRAGRCRARAGGGAGRALMTRWPRAAALVRGWVAARGRCCGGSRRARRSRSAMVAAPLPARAPPPPPHRTGTAAPPAPPTLRSSCPCRWSPASAARPKKMWAPSSRGPSIRVSAGGTLRGRGRGPGAPTVRPRPPSARRRWRLLRPHLERSGPLGSGRTFGSSSRFGERGWGMDWGTDLTGSGWGSTRRRGGSGNTSSSSAPCQEERKLREHLAFYTPFQEERRLKEHLAFCCSLPGGEEAQGTLRFLHSLPGAWMGIGLCS